MFGAPSPRHKQNRPTPRGAAGRGLVIVAASQSLAAAGFVTGHSVDVALAAAAEAGAEGVWLRVIPAGTVRLNDGRGPYLCKPDQVVTVSAERAAASGVELPIDYDHQLEHTEKNGAGAPASGWIRELQARADGVWARIVWTERAAAQIRAREYRYLSPVFAHDAQGNIVFIARAGLTNKPALLDAPRVAASQENLQMDLAALAAALGLKADATLTECMAAITRMHTTHTAICAAAGVAVASEATAIIAGVQSKTTPDPAQWIAASEYNRVNGELATLRASSAQRDIDETIAVGLRDGKIAPASKDYWLAVCAEAKSAAPLKKYLETAPVVVPGGTAITSATPPAALATGADKLTNEERAVCASLGLSAEDYLKSKAA